MANVSSIIIFITVVVYLYLLDLLLVFS